MGMNPGAGWTKWLAVVGGVLVLGACAPVLRPGARVPSAALTTSEDTTLGRALAEAIGNNPGKSGFHALASGSAAFGARVAMIDAAERALDVEDRSAPEGDVGVLVCERLLRAADRGVRVRILLDDLPGGSWGSSLSSLAAHENIQLRLFNPLPRRSNFFSRLWSGSPEDPRSNRRLHGRALVADNAVGVVGGRVGGWQRPEGDGGALVEGLELLAAGPVVKQVSAHFDEFWESDLSVPVQSVFEKPPTAADLDKLRTRLREQRVPLPWVDWMTSRGGLAHRLRDGTLPLTWAPARLLADRPGFARAGDESAYGIAALAPLLGDLRSELLVLSPYFVPGRDGADTLIQLKSRGVSVRVLTWALSATDAPAIQSVYARYRIPLLLKKVELHELREMAGKAKTAAGNQPVPGVTALDPSVASSHSRALVFDRHSVFVGTIALDARLAAYASELGVLVESPELANRIAALMDRGMQLDLSFRVGLKPEPLDPRRDHLVWNVVDGGREYLYEREPETNFLQRASDGMLPLFSPDGL